MCGEKKLEIMIEISINDVERKHILSFSTFATKLSLDVRKTKFIFV